LAELSGTPYLRWYLGGSDLTDNVHPSRIIDVSLLDEGPLRTALPRTYQYLLENVKPDRDAAERDNHRLFWWRFGEARVDMRAALKDLPRFIATTETAKHRTFSFLGSDILPDQKLRVLAFADGYELGVLSSAVHIAWSNATGGRQGVGNDPVYNHPHCFGKFPFPADVSERLRDQIRDEANALDALRKQVLAEHKDLTLTQLYNVLEAQREGRPLSDTECYIHDRGLVTLIRQHHDRIDALVAEAYGWPVGLADEEILTRLVTLNRTRAAEEAKGHIRWLRPEYQAPDYQAPVTQSLDLGDGPAYTGDNVIPWPVALPDQVSAIQSVLAASPTPLAPQDVARAFKGKRASSVRPVLDALAGIGMARRLADGRYAA
jgi:hypothetical protein